MKKKIVKKGIVKKTDTEMLLLAGSKITTLSDQGEVISYLLGSDISITLDAAARLFPTR
jgi:hypothetical protein